MQTSDFDFELPQHLIAASPSVRRGDDKLMLLRYADGSITHLDFSDILQMIPPNALMIFNNSKVRKARIMATAESGSQVEFLLLQQLSDSCWLTMVSKSKRQKAGRRYLLPAGVTAEIMGEGQAVGTKIVAFSKMTEAYLEEFGSIPLPPYMQREAQSDDETRYQTVYAKDLGSAAAPTAGLHFTDDLLTKLQDKGVELAFATLHVGLGTFAPVHAPILTDHKMHREYYHISEPCAAQLNQAKDAHRPMIAVGTTSARLLESAMQASHDGRFTAGDAYSEIFIYPGYQFKAISGLLTNFHTPKSTLLAMVSALAGYDLIKKSYAIAIEKEYRFFSYGDAMLILP
jgi:S-adenosylmethionine:tRNA ribosyltransferase-isomerase